MCSVQKSSLSICCIVTRLVFLDSVCVIHSAVLLQVGFSWFTAGVYGYDEPSVPESQAI